MSHWTRQENNLKLSTFYSSKGAFALLYWLKFVPLFTTVNQKFKGRNSVTTKWHHHYVFQLNHMSELWLSKNLKIPSMDIFIFKNIHLLFSRDKIILGRLCLLEFLIATKYESITNPSHHPYPHPLPGLLGVHTHAHLPASVDKHSQRQKGELATWNYSRYFSCILIKLLVIVFFKKINLDPKPREFLKPK